MGTRSTYTIFETWENKRKQTITNIYFQFDGYPTGHPLDVAKWLSEHQVVNGFGSKDEKVFNGAGCLAAQLIKKFKDGVGGIYIIPKSQSGNSGESYAYHIIVDMVRKTIRFEAYQMNKYEVGGTKSLKIFTGTPQEFCKKFEKDDETKFG